MIVLSDPLLFEVEHLLFAGGQRIEIQCARVTELEAAGRTDEAERARELLAIFTESVVVTQQFIALEESRLAARGV